MNPLKIQNTSLGIAHILFKSRNIASCSGADKFSLVKTAASFSPPPPRSPKISRGPKPLELLFLNTEMPTL